MIAEENMESMREAVADDVGGIMKLLEPFENEGILVKRPREKLEREINHFTVLEHDGIIYGSAALYPYQEAFAPHRAAGPRTRAHAAFCAHHAHIALVYQSRV